MFIRPGNNITVFISSMEWKVYEYVRISLTRTKLICLVKLLDYQKEID